MLLRRRQPDNLNPSGVAPITPLSARHARRRSPTAAPASRGCRCRTLTSEKVTEGPIGVGTGFTATVRAGRRDVGMGIEYTAFDRPHLLASTTRMATAV